MNEKEIIGKRISEVRQSKGIKQTELAAKLGFSRQYLSVIELGKHKTSKKNLKKIADALGCDETYLTDVNTQIPNMQEHILKMVQMAALANGYTDSITNDKNYQKLIFTKKDKQVSINKDYLAKFCLNFTKSFEDCLEGFGEVKEI